MRDNTDSWNYKQLELFRACPVVNARRIKHILGQLETDEDLVRRLAEYKKSLARGRRKQARPSPRRTQGPATTRGPDQGPAPPKRTTCTTQAPRVNKCRYGGSLWW